MMKSPLVGKRAMCFRRWAISIPDIMRTLFCFACPLYLILFFSLYPSTLQSCLFCFIFGASAPTHTRGASERVTRMYDGGPDWKRQNILQQPSDVHRVPLFNPPQSLLFSLSFLSSSSHRVRVVFARHQRRMCSYAPGDASLSGNIWKSTTSRRLIEMGWNEEGARGGCSCFFPVRGMCAYKTILRRLKTKEGGKKGKDPHTGGRTDQSPSVQGATYEELSA